MRLFRVFLSVLAVLLAPAAQAQSNVLNVDGWVNRAGVRAVVVEFYATWCKPCMEALPRWRALQQKYAAEGLRLVVVNTRDPSNNCAPPAWQPDQFICDAEGVIADRFGVGELPSALMWSWQGNLLVAHGHVLRILTATWLGLDAKAGRLFALDPARLSALGFEHEQHVIRQWNA